MKENYPSMKKLKDPRAGKRPRGKRLPNEPHPCGGTIVRRHETGDVSSEAESDPLIDSSEQGDADPSAMDQIKEK